MKHGQRGGLHQSVEPRAGKADVVSAADMIDARVGDPRQERPGGLLPPRKEVERCEHAQPSRCGRAAGWPPGRVRRARRRADHRLPAGWMFWLTWNVLSGS